MEKFYLKSVALGALLALSANAMAGDIYVSASGSDANDGSSAANALATVNAAVAKAVSGDVIKVTGKVKVDETIKLEAFGDLTIEGTSSAGECTLDGQKKVQILNVLNTNLTLRNLTITKGYVEAEKNARGGAMWCRGKVVTIDGCVFSSNETPTRNEDNGGAIFVTDGTLNISSSKFTKNVAYRGGAIEAQASTLNISNTEFSKNYTMAAEGSNSGASSGGALAIGKSTTEMKYVTLTNNSATGRGGAMIVWIDGTNGKKLNMMGCAVLNNEAGSPGGAFNFGLNNDGDFRYNILSTTIYGNTTTGGAGGVVAIDSPNSNAGQQMNFVNCTITGNSTALNVGNCGGFAVNGGSKLKAKLNIVNTILEGNSSSQGWSDSRFARNEDPDYVTVINSIIGHAFRDVNDGELKNVTNSVINSTGQNKDNPLTAGLVDDIVEDCLPLKADSKCLTMGSVEEAAKYGCTVDQKGQPWTKPYIGAVQLVEGEDIPEAPTAIKGVEVAGADKQGFVDNAYYTLQGVRVAKPGKGVFIHNGKKIVVK